MAIDYSALRFSKGTPRIIERRRKQLDRAAEERACRQAVDQRDGRRCFFPNCRAHASEKHHIRPSSVRGKRIWQTNDILSACAEHHRWFKAGLIQVSGNPDRGPVRVVVTRLGEEAGIRIPSRGAA